MSNCYNGYMVNNKNNMQGADDEPRDVENVAPARHPLRRHRQNQEVQVRRGDRILPQVCTASAVVNMKHVLKQMQSRFAVIYGTQQ